MVVSGFRIWQGLNILSFKVYTVLYCCSRVALGGFRFILFCATVVGVA